MKTPDKTIEVFVSRYKIISAQMRYSKDAQDAAIKRQQKLEGDKPTAEMHPEIKADYNAARANMEQLSNEYRLLDGLLREIAGDNVADEIADKYLP